MTNYRLFCSWCDTKTSCLSTFKVYWEYLGKKCYTYQETRAQWKGLSKLTWSFSNFQLKIWFLSAVSVKLTLIVQDFCDSPIFWRESYMYSEWQIDELCTIIVSQTASSFTLKQIKCALKNKKWGHYFMVFIHINFLEA